MFNAISLTCVPRLPLVANGRACNSARAPVACIVCGLLQNQNLGSLGDLALLHLSRCVHECGGGNIHGGIHLWLSPILVRPTTFLSTGRCEAHQYPVNVVAVPVFHAFSILCRYRLPISTCKPPPRKSLILLNVAL